MARIVRSDSAKNDIQAIAAYIAADNLPAADRWLDALDKKLVLLASNPLLGELVDHLAPGIRRHGYGNYLI